MPAKAVTRAAALIVAALLAGCTTDGPTSPPASTGTSEAPTAAPTSAATAAQPTPTAPPASELYGEIRAAVEEIRGLQPTKAVEPVTIDEAQLRTNLTVEFDKENSPEELALAEDQLIALGLLPAGADLRAIMLDLNSGQVAGYYAPDTDKLFVVSRSGGLGILELVTYAHEFTHQLQDQNMDLGALGLDVTDQSDRQIARLALVEGDASSVQAAWMTSNLTPEQLGELLGASLDPEGLAALQRAPAFVRETSLFSYSAGLGFVNALLADGGGYAAVDAAYTDPPDSTEQIMHPEKYLAGEAPKVVTIPAGIPAALGTGWKAAGQDTLGELILGIWLRAGKVAAAESRTAAAGWAGDRMILLRGPNGAVGIGLITEWDSAGEAAEFSSAAAAAVDVLDPNGLVLSQGATRVLVTMGARAEDIISALYG